MSGRLPRTHCAVNWNISRGKRRVSPPNTVPIFLETLCVMWFYICDVLYFYTVEKLNNVSDLQTHQPQRKHNSEILFHVLFQAQIELQTVNIVSVHWLKQNSFWLHSSQTEDLQPLLVKFHTECIWCFFLFLLWFFFQSWIRCFNWTWTAVHRLHWTKDMARH